MTNDQALSDSVLPEALVEVEGGEEEDLAAREPVEGLARGLRRKALPLGERRITEQIVSGVSTRFCILM